MAGHKDTLMRLPATASSVEAMTLDTCQQHVDDDTCITRKWCHVNGVTLIVSSKRCHMNGVTLIVSSKRCHVNGATWVMLREWCHVDEVSWGMSSG